MGIGFGPTGETKRQENLRVGDADVSAGNPVPVDVVSSIELVSSGITIPVTPVIAAVLYAAGENVGDLMEFANAARVAGAGGVIKSLLTVDDASQSVQLELWLFDQTFDAGADQAAWTPTVADLHNLVAIISTADGIWYIGGATGTVNNVEVSKRYDCVGTSLFGRYVNRGAPTYAATTDITAILGLLQD